MRYIGYIKARNVHNVLLNGLLTWCMQCFLNICNVLFEIKNFFYRYRSSLAVVPTSPQDFIIKIISMARKTVLTDLFQPFCREKLNYKFDEKQHHIWLEEVHFCALPLLLPMTISEIAKSHCRNPNWGETTFSPFDNGFPAVVHSRQWHIYPQRLRLLSATHVPADWDDHGLVTVKISKGLIAEIVPARRLFLFLRA